MTLLKDWEHLLENQNKDSVDKFWAEYSEAEINIYKDILREGTGEMKGSISYFCEKYNVRPVIFMGFLDGINTSLESSLNLDTLKEEEEICLNIDLKRLYLNMLKVPAEHLYSLEEWSDVLSSEEIEQITRDYKNSRTIVKEKKIGRNQPCPCGSGKKYKHCCGK